MGEIQGFYSEGCTGTPGARPVRKHAI